ncbi:hypothetical protein Tco_0067478 [Tanacetum coccineum]
MTPATTTSSLLQNLPNFASLFGFDYRLKALEDNFSELRQTNQYAEALSSIPSTVDQYLANKMQEAVDVAVQLKYDRIREESSTANQQFLDSIDDGMKKIIKEQVKKEVSKIIPKIENCKSSELELKKILIDKMEANKLFNRSEIKDRLYKALVDAYDSRQQSYRGSKRRRSGKEPASTSAPRETTTKTAGKTTSTGSKTHKKSASQSALVEEAMQPTDVFEGPADQEFETGVHDEQAEEEVNIFPTGFNNLQDYLLLIMHGISLFCVHGKVTNLNVEEVLHLMSPLKCLPKELSSRGVWKIFKIDKTLYTYIDPRGFILRELRQEEQIVPHDEYTSSAMVLVMKSRYALKGLKNEKEIDALHNTLPAYSMSERLCCKLSEITLISLTPKHAEYDESNTYVLERFNTSAGNPVKKILLKLNLSDHRLCKMVVECQSVKVKEFQERCNIKAFQEWYEHVGPEVASPQDGKVIRWRRDCAWLMISRGSRSLCQIQVQGTSSIQEVNDHYNIFTRERQEYELKTKDKA